MPARPACRATALPADRILRQVQSIDAWNAAYRLRKQSLLGAAASREDRLEVACRLDALQRTHAAVAKVAERRLATEPGPMLTAVPTAVVAHGHPWFADKVCALLSQHGAEIVGRTDNGADALGAVIAEQPDLLLVGDRLAMTTGADLLSDAALFSPRTVTVAHANGEHAPFLQAAGADEAFLRQHPPADVAHGAARLVFA